MIRMIRCGSRSYSTRSDQVSSYMKTIYLFPLLFVLSLTFAAFSQEPADAGKRQRNVGRPKFMAALGLSPEQMKEIGRLNRERRPKMQAAQQRLRESVRALDAAIYADTVDDAEVRLRLREHQDAQSEIARLRFEGELAMRKVLSPEQLVKFREVRQRFNAARERNQRQRRLRRDRPADDRRRRAEDGERTIILN